MTMFFWPKCVSLLYYCYILCGYYIPVYVDTVALTFLELVLSLKLYSTLSRCRFVVVAKVKKIVACPALLNLALLINQYYTMIPVSILYTVQKFLKHFWPQRKTKPFNSVSDPNPGAL